jgi:aspartate aminotransferase
MAFMNLSDRIQGTQASQTVGFTALIQQLKKQGREIIDFAVGEPAFDPPAQVLAATRAALDAGATRYGPVGGLPELREALAEKFDGFSPENIIISNGSKQCLYAIFQTLCNPGDEVIIPSPCWVSFSEQVKLAGGRPVLVDTQDHQLSLPAIQKAVTARTAAILINSPNNPTGAVYPRSDLEGIVKIALEHDLYVISDEAYDAFIYDGAAPPDFLGFKEIRHRLIITRSFSKTYAMTGFRVGYTAAPRTIANALARHQSHCTGNVCTFAQHGALAALSVDPDFNRIRREELQCKRDIAHDYAARVFRCVRPQGAFYLFPDVSAHLKPAQTSGDFAAFLLERTGVAVVPGEAFGKGGHIRISYAVDEETLIKGFKKILEAL